MLDPETLLLVQVSFTLLTTILLVSAALYSDSSMEQRLWASGNVASCLGLALGAWTRMPLAVHGVLSYGLMALGLAWVLQGLLQFFRRDLHWRWVVAIAVIGMLLPGYFAFVQPSLLARLVVTGLYFALLNGACVYALLRHGSGPSMWPAAVGFGALCVVMLVRAFYLAAGPASEEQVTRVMSASLFAVPLAQVCILFGLIMMVARRYAVRLRQLSALDGLTGALNRGAFEVQGQRILQRAAQAGRSVTVAMVDADHFKRINDTHGHLVGDEVLRQLVTLLSTQLRPADLLARYGGEEFVLVLDGLRLEDAVKVAERLRLLVQQQVVSVEKVSVSCTVSMGLACSDQHGHALTALVAAGDAALYAAKATGRNRVTTAPA